MNKDELDELLSEIFFLQWASILMIAPAQFEDKDSKYLSGLLFDLAVNKKWIEEPPKGNVELGSWYVTADHATDFLVEAHSCSGSRI